MICVAALCRTSSSPLLKLNTAMTYKIGTKALSAILDAMKLIRSPPVDNGLGITYFSVDILKDMVAC